MSTKCNIICYVAGGVTILIMGILLATGATHTCANSGPQVTALDRMDMD